MKVLIRNFLFNLVTLWGVSYIMPGLAYSGGVKTLAMGALGLMLINLAIIPILKIMFLPLNILTLGIFTWVINVVGLYLLTTMIPQFKLIPYFFPGGTYGGISLPIFELNVLQVAILASFLIGFISHFLQWLSK